MAVVEAKNIILKSYDDEVFEIDEIIAMGSQMLKNMIEDDCTDAIIRLPNITSKILAKLIEYCKKHIEVALRPQLADDDKENEDSKAWDAEYMQAANYMNIKGLLDLTCRTVADIIKGKTTEEIRKISNIENDFTPEEEQEIQEN